jgi:hypothetical protein
VPTRGLHYPERHQHREEGKGAADAQPALGGGDIEKIQQKARRRDATSDLLLKYLNTTLATYV